ncbi:hypothetical protein AAGG74_18470 [Bacillus mexicanus]|uniref:hypothetical protein n=1 Tax=Bacillus mexicanus TaxID=2834415 RepID=UPI003D1B5B35
MNNREESGQFSQGVNLTENNNENYFWQTIFALPLWMRLGILFSAPALILMNRTAIIFCLLLIPILFSRMKNELLRDILIVISLLYYLDYWVFIIFAFRFFGPLKRYYDLGIFGFIFSVVAIFHSFIGQPSIGYAFFEYNWKTRHGWETMFFVSLAIYLVVFVIAKMAFVNMAKSHQNTYVKRGNENKPETKKQPKVEKIDPSKGSFKNAKSLVVEEWIRKD